MLTRRVGVMPDMNRYRRHQSLRRLICRGYATHPSQLSHSRNRWGCAKPCGFMQQQNCTFSIRDTLASMNTSRGVYFRKSMNKCHSRRVCSTPLVSRGAAGSLTVIYLKIWNLRVYGSSPSSLLYLGHYALTFNAERQR